MVICCICKKELNHKELLLSFEKFLYCKFCYKEYYKEFILPNVFDNADHNATLTEAIEQNKISEYDLSLRCNLSNIRYNKNYLDVPVLLYVEKIKKYYKGQLDLQSIPFYNNKIRELDKKFNDSSIFSDVYKSLLLRYLEEFNLIFEILSHDTIQQYVKEDLYLLLALLNFELGENSNALINLNKINSEALFKLEKYYLILKYLGSDYFKLSSGVNIHQLIQEIGEVQCEVFSNTRYVVKNSLSFKQLQPCQPDQLWPHHPSCFYSLEIELFKQFLFHQNSESFLETLLNLKKLIKATNSQYLTQVKIQAYISDYFKEKSELKLSILHLQKAIVILIEKDFGNSYICMEYYLKLSELQMQFADDKYLSNIQKVLQTSISKNYTDLIVKSLEFLKKHFTINNSRENIKLIDSKLLTIINRTAQYPNLD